MTTSWQVRHLVARMAQRYPSQPRSLAEPPVGSGLKPVLGDPGPPVLGASLSMMADLLHFGRINVDKFGPVHWLNALGTTFVFVVGAEGLETVAANRDRAFANEAAYEYLIGPFFHRGVLLMDYDEHLLHRRIMQQAFSRERLAGYLRAMNPVLDRGIAQWAPSPRFRILDATKLLTLSVATEVFVGEPAGSDADAVAEAFVDAVHGGQAVVRADVPGGLWHRGLEGRALLERYFREKLPNKRAGNTDDLFSALCRAETEDGERFTDEDVVNHMIFVLMAAHDTSTITASMLAYYLGKHPQWQERARAQSRALGTATLQFDDLATLTVLDAAIKETLRLAAPVGGMIRQVVKDTQILGHHVPAGVMVFASIYNTQRDPGQWPNPDEFDPSRFAEDYREDRSHRYAWAPFGGGAHKCIGMHFGVMEVKAILHKLLLGHRWTIEPGYAPPIGYGTGPTPVDGVPIRFERLP